MIDKTIHYIWLSKKRMPFLNRKCIKSWKKVLGDYKIRRWTLKDFNLSEMPYVKEAVKAKKWAFATDYLRLYVLNKEGGIYLDSDVLVLKDFKDLLDNPFFSCIEYHHDSTSAVIQAAFMGSERENIFIKKVLSYYEKRHFIRQDGTLDVDLLAPDILAEQAKSFGFDFYPVEQRVERVFTIYDSKIVAGTPWERHPDNVAIHMCAGSWRNASLKTRIEKNLLLLRILHEKH